MITSDQPKNEEARAQLCISRFPANRQTAEVA
jgi:hypothetical protein